MPDVKFGINVEKIREFVRKFKNSVPAIWGPQLKEFDCGGFATLLSCKQAKWYYWEEYKSYLAEVTQCNKCEKIFLSKYVIIIMITECFRCRWLRCNDRAKLDV